MVYQLDYLSKQHQAVDPPQKSVNKYHCYESQYHKVYDLLIVVLLQQQLQ